MGGDCRRHHQLAGRAHQDGGGPPYPVVAPAMALLNGVPRNGSDFVFSADGKTPVNGWSRAKRRLDAATKINQPWVIHDSRRTVATGCQKLGGNLQTVEAILGHTGGGGAHRQGLPSPRFRRKKRAAVEQWGAYVASIL